MQSTEVAPRCACALAAHAWCCFAGQGAAGAYKGCLPAAHQCAPAASRASFRSALSAAAARRFLSCVACAHPLPFRCPHPHCSLYFPQPAPFAAPPHPHLFFVNSHLASLILSLSLFHPLSLPPSPHPVMTGAEGINAVAVHPEAVSVVTGIVGCAGLYPTVAAIKAGKDICLANKETLIAGGPYVLPLARKHGINILPADSEHSAIFQCIQGLPEGGLRRIILTASGGAFRDWAAEDLHKVKVADALKHPNWSMGKKITVDSATLMNKGLEVIEAHYLFGAAYDDIDIVIHPQSIIHSMVETADSSVIAQLGWPDMRLPILYTMSWPERQLVQDATWPRLDFVKMGNLTFRAPDKARAPRWALDRAVGAGVLWGWDGMSLRESAGASKRAEQAASGATRGRRLEEFGGDAFRGDARKQGQLRCAHAHPCPF